MFKYLAPAAVVLCLATSVQACPWASGTYSASVSPDHKLTVVFDGNCATASIVLTGEVARNVNLTQSSTGWSSKDAEMSATFDTKGKRARVSLGGAARTVRMRKQ